MKKYIVHILKAFVASWFFVPTMLRAQDQIVVVTVDGDLQVYPITDMGNFSFDADADWYTLTTEGRTMTFDGKGIKQIYFADKNETDNDPYIVPKSGDQVNPNFERLADGSYEIIEMDTTLCRVRIRFLNDVPKLYVGRILSLDYDDRPYNCYVLTSRQVDGVYDIRFRNALLRELIYNTNFVMTDKPDDLYFPTSAQAVKAQPFAVNKRRDIGSDLLPITLGKQLYDLYDSNEIKFITQTNTTFGCELNCDLGDPVPGTESIRSYTSQVKFLGLVFRGDFEKRSTTKVQVDRKFSLSYGKVVTNHPFFTQKPITIGMVPFWVIATADFGAQIEAAIEREFRYAHTETDQLSATVGFEYRGEEDHFNPIFNITPKHFQEKPDFEAKSQKAFVKFSPYVELALTVDLFFTGYMDLMPFIRANYEGLVLNGIDDYSQWKFDVGGNVRLGLRFNTLRNDQSIDLFNWTSPDLFVTTIASSPEHLVNLDSLRQVYNSYDSKSTANFQVYYKDHITDEYVIPTTGQEMCVEQEVCSDFPEEQVREAYGKTQAPLHRSFQPVTPVELHPIGKKWGTVCDASGVAHTEYTSKVPLGYRTVLKTRILNGKGETVEEIEEEFPYEIKNFDATVSIGQYGGSTIKYRDGGKSIFEHVVGEEGAADFKYENGQAYVNTPMGWFPYSGGATPIAEQMGVVNRAMTHSPYVWDWCRYLKMELGQDTENMTFGDVELLGLPCKTVSIPEGVIVYWQNLQLSISSGNDAGFIVTKLDILDNPVELQ